MSDEKTEEPSEKRLRDARRDGEVAKSTDLVDAALLGFGLLALLGTSRLMYDAIRDGVTIALDFVSGDHDLIDIFVALRKIGLRALGAALPPLGAAVLGVLVALAPQVGFQISTKPVALNFQAVSPMAGLKRIFGLKAVIDLAKMLLKGVLVTAVMWFTIKGLLPLVVGSLYQPLDGLFKLFGDLIFKLLGTAAVVFLVLGAADVKLQRWLFLRGKRMSKDEVKREHKEQEGDPKIKGERKRLAREMASSAPTSRVATANMMLVNPTHYAVAIRYAPLENPLPVIVAKGMDEAAAALRREAQRHQVPIIGNPPVARALFKVELDQPIPEELFQTVAAILRWVESLGVSPEARSGMPASASS